MPIPWSAVKIQRVVGLGARVERAVEHLHDVLRADQGQVLRRVRLRVGAGIGHEQPSRRATPSQSGRAPIQSFSSSKMWSSASAWIALRHACIAQGPKS